MADVNQLFGEFIKAHLAGSNPDPWEYVGRLEGDERTELEELIDAYYVDAPPRQWDAEAFRGSAAERIADSIDRSFRGQAGWWPAVLPRLRDKARLKRSEVVKRLAKALGVGDREQKVAGYYHEMEHGLLPSERVSKKVLDALAGIVGTTGDALRKAGRPLTPEISSQDAADAVFARTAHPQEEWTHTAGALAQEADAPAPADRTDWDEVDELFLGG